MRRVGLVSAQGWCQSHSVAVTRAMGLLAQTPFDITCGFGAFGVVACFATAECPPCPGLVKSHRN